MGRGGVLGGYIWGGSGKNFTWSSGPQLDLLIPHKGVGLNPSLKSATERVVELLLL